MEKSIKISNQTNWIKVTVFFMLVTSSMIVVQVQEKTLFLMLQILFCLTMFFCTKKLVFHNSILINLIVVELVISAVFSCLSDIPLSYKKTAVYMTALMVIVYFVASYLIYEVRKGYLSLDFIKKCLKITCLIQLLWTIFQFLCYEVFLFDVNKFIFVDSLGIVQKASVFKPGNLFMPSGLSWHPSLLASLIVVAFFLYDKWYMKCLSLLVAVICNNSTALIGAILCVGVELIRISANLLRKKKINRKVLLLVLIAVVLVGVVVYETGLINEVFNKIYHMYQRIFGLVYDGGSADAHKRYFTAYLDVVNNSSVVQVLLGYGEGCSGYPYDVLFDQYSFWSNWAVESDIMNILVSRGIIGFVLYYAMLLYTAIKGFKINYKYSVIITIIAFQGITYNVQFDWIVILEMIFLFCITHGWDFFVKEKCCH